MIFATIFTYLNFKSDLLQKTIFSNQMVSTYKVQSTMEDFIERNKLDIITEIKRIEANYNSKNFTKNSETTEVLFVNNPGHLKNIDTIEMYQSSKKETKKRRKIITELYENTFENKLSKNSSFNIAYFTIMNNKVSKIHIYLLEPFSNHYYYNQGVTIFPEGITITDQKKYSPSEEF